jgi:hypothetical protein
VATSKKESQKFLESHRKSLIDMKAAAQSELLREIAPGFQALPPNEGAVGAERFLAGVEKAHEQALQIQYLQSVAQWGQLISGGTGADLTAAQKGVLRMTYTADSPTGTLKIVKASLEDMDKDVLDRIHGSQTLASMKLADLPISKVFMGDGGLEGPPFIVVMPGQSPEPRTMGPWIDQRGEKYGIDKSNMSRYGYQTVAALMVGEMANLTLGELGLIKGGTGGN